VGINFISVRIFEFSHIDGHPQFAKRSINHCKKVEIAAIDPDFQSRPQASVPDGICWQIPNQPVELFMLPV